MRVIKEENLTILNQAFDNDCSIQLSIRKTQVEQALFKLSKVNGTKVKYDHSI
jgi:hypothetical protein